MTFLLSVNCALWGTGPLAGRKATYWKAALWRRSETVGFAAANPQMVRVEKVQTVCSARAQFTERRSSL